MNRILINGERSYLPIDGMNRYLIEMVRSLDSIVKNDRYVLVIPSNVDREFYDGIKDLKNIQIKKTILPYFRFWTFLYIDIAELFSHRIVINIANRNSVFGGGINVLHDIIPLKFYSDRNRKYLKRLNRLTNTSDCLIVTSGFTSDDIKNTMNCKCKIQIIHLGWQHYQEIQEDQKIFNEYPCIKRGSYYFTISSISPHKNLKFIYEVAKRNPDTMFVIVGAMNRGYGFEYNDLENLLLLGRIRDKKSKALMMNCRAFIFPSLYEGAGLPPLEALSCKVPVLAADIEVLHEYCGDSVHYFDPYDYDIDLEEVLKTKVAKPEEALGILSWNKAAKELKDIVEGCCRKME
ncbi:MAG: glycosyltransferase family 4 protein [Lachnospiraceae bacterium]|nr:glycosyltransferase family 4 protein [Lachnospiraceae bacterium]